MSDAARGYVSPEYLRAVGEQVARLKAASYDLMEVQAGDRVLDVGCGPGIDTIALAARVGASGTVDGVDFDSGMVAAADRAAADADVGDRVHHQRADATALPFPSDHFSAVRSERVFLHVSAPERVLAEMVRVVRPGGRVVVIDSDYGTGSIDTEDIDLERRVWRHKSEHALNNGYSGRQLYRLFRRAGLLDVSVKLIPNVTTSFAFACQVMGLDALEASMIAAGVATEAEMTRWRASLELADAEGVFFASITQTMAAGRKA